MIVSPPGMRMFEHPPEGPRTAAAHLEGLGYAWNLWRGYSLVACPGDGAFFHTLPLEGASKKPLGRVDSARVSYKAHSRETPTTESWVYGQQQTREICCHTVLSIQRQSTSYEGFRNIFSYVYGGLDYLDYVYKHSRWYQDRGRLVQRRSSHAVPGYVDCVLDCVGLSLVYIHIKIRIEIRVQHVVEHVV